MMPHALTARFYAALAIMEQWDAMPDGTPGRDYWLSITQANAIGWSSR